MQSASLVSSTTEYRCARLVRGYKTHINQKKREEWKNERDIMFRFYEEWLPYVKPILLQIPEPL